MNKAINTYFIPIITVLLISGCSFNPYGLGNGNTTYLGGLGGNVPISQLQGQGDTVSFWDAGNASGKPLVKINLEQQKARFYMGSTLVGVSRISSGGEGFGTPPGSYKILQKNADHISNIYGVWKTPDGTVVNDDVDLRKQPVPPRFNLRRCTYAKFYANYTGGVGMHAGYIPGYPASHGCIRMPEKMSSIFFANVSIGTPVIVEP